MTDQTLTALVSAATGGAVYAQTSAVSLPIPLSAMTSILSMAAAALVTWGMFKKASERHDTEIDLLRTNLSSMHNMMADIRERVARIEGKLEPDKP